MKHEADQSSLELLVRFAHESNTLVIVETEQITILKARD